MKIARPSRKTLMQFTLVILVIFAMRLWQQHDLTQGKVPNFSSTSLTGEILSSQPPPNQAMLIHFWATWCGICRFENDNVQALNKDYKVLNIAMQSGTDDELRQYATQHQLSTHNIINDNTGSLARLFGVRGTPSSFFINPQGAIQFIEVGYVTELGYRLRLWWASL